MLEVVTYLLLVATTLATGFSIHRTQPRHWIRNWVALIAVVSGGCAFRLLLVDQTLDDLIQTVAGALGGLLAVSLGDVGRLLPDGWLVEPDEEERRRRKAVRNRGRRGTYILGFGLILGVIVYVFAFN